MRSHILPILFFAVFTAICSAAPDDAHSAKLILGKWKWGRYATVQYTADGTYLISSMEETTYGRWRIRNGHLIEVFRAKGESKDSSTTYDIRVLDDEKLVICDRSQRGAILTHSRIH